MKTIGPISTIAAIHDNLSVPLLVEHELQLEEGILGVNGATICMSGIFTGRSPRDKFFVDEATSNDKIWWGTNNQKTSNTTFNALLNKVKQHLKEKDIYVFEGFCGADPAHRLRIRIITEKAWHVHFANNMFVAATPEQRQGFAADFTIVNAATCYATDYQELGLHSSTFIVFNLAENIALIGGTEYAGEMKKGIFSVMNYVMPQQGILPMHCSANIGESDDVALFFGLSGTGKTTLSADPKRRLIGDDEHGWSEQGVFNFEGGCYAKAIHLSEEKEPNIWNAIRFGAIVENVAFDAATRNIDFDDDSITENTRVSYPLSYIDNIKADGMGGIPTCIIFLTCDAFGVLPPVARLTPQLASYHFLSGYTAKIAGTERGITEPQAVFSTCFGAPFMTLPPQIYCDLLSEKMAQHNVPAYLVNTGWSGGGYGVGKRMDLCITRKIVDAILDGSVQQAPVITDPCFGFAVPTKLSGVDSHILQPMNTWRDAKEYTVKRNILAQMFQDNFASFAAHAAHLAIHGPRCV